MKNPFIALFIAVIIASLVLFACKGKSDDPFAGSSGNQATDGSGNGPDDGKSTHAPAISNWECSRTTLQRQSAGVSVVACSYEFSDDGGDIASQTYTYFDTDGDVISRETETMKVDGLTSGVVGHELSLKTSATGSFPVSLYVTDSTGSKSNVLTTVFRVQ